MYVLDNDTTDGSTDSPGFQKIFVHHESAWDDPWMTDMVCRAQRELLLRYRYVLYTDVDEFIVPDPRRYADLIEYIEKFDKNCIQAKSYTVCHDYRSEPQLDLNQPILTQRSLWADMGRDWGKTCLSKIPLNWSVGQHSCVQNEARDTDKRLFLVHLAMVDIELCRQRRKDRSEGWIIGSLSGKHVLDTSNEGIMSHADSLLKHASLIPEFIRAVVI